MERGSGTRKMLEGKGWEAAERQNAPPSLPHTDVFCERRTSVGSSRTNWPMSEVHNRRWCINWSKSEPWEFWVKGDIHVQTTLPECGSTQRWQEAETSLHSWGGQVTGRDYCSDPLVHLSLHTEIWFIIEVGLFHWVRHEDFTLGLHCTKFRPLRDAPFSHI